MKFCDLAQFMHHKYEKKIHAGEFVKILTDAILDDEALDKTSPNPLYSLGKSTLEAYYSGRRPLSQKKAAALVPRLDEAKFADFVNTYSLDALNYMRDKLAEFGFEVSSLEVGQACANILAQIIQRRSEGLSDDVIVLNYQRMETGRTLKAIAPATIERRGDKLHIAGEVITIHQMLVPDDVSRHELDYIRALYEVYAEKLKKESFTADDVPSLPKRYAENYQEETMIVTNARFEKKRLTWRNLLRVFYLDENRIDDSDSIVEPKHRYMENTLFLSALLYLITGKSFSETDAQEKKEIKKARRLAVTEYVNRKIQDAAERKKQLEKDLHIFDGADVEEQIAKATAALQETQRKIDHALAESQKILSSILDAEERAAECDVLLTRYHRLSEQYKADIQRLSMIVEGEEAYREIPQPTICPYCEGTISPRKRVSYIASSKVEMERTMAQLAGLEDTEKDVEDRKKEIRSELDELKRQRDVLESKIKKKLRPQESEQQNTVNAYKAYLRITSEIALIETYATDFGNDLTALETDQQNDKKLEYHPKEYFGDDFATTMSEYANSILKECCYTDLVQAHFNFTTFDIEVNGEDKGTSHGKGYHSYLNTVMIMMLRKYLAANAKFDPHIFIIDTPLHGFDDGVDDKMPDSMRAGLYRYFMNHQDEGQLIIIENLDHIPSLDYEKSGAVVETFGKGLIPNTRYGFLNDVK